MNIEDVKRLETIKEYGAEYAESKKKVEAIILSEKPGNLADLEKKAKISKLLSKEQMDKLLNDIYGYLEANENEANEYIRRIELPSISPLLSGLLEKSSKPERRQPSKAVETETADAEVKESAEASA